MGIFSRKKTSLTGSDVLQRQSCSGCSGCFSKPIESLPPLVQEKLEGVRAKLIEARRLYLDAKKPAAAETAKEAKALIAQLSSSGDFRSSIDSMFAAHVPEAEIQLFIARS
ncbi:MAG: hypothetical protein AB1529_07615 [Candidatus Micrarchaeota archaeon]